MKIRRSELILTMSLIYHVICGWRSTKMTVSHSFFLCAHIWLFLLRGHVHLSNLLEPGLASITYLINRILQKRFSRPTRVRPQEVPQFFPVFFTVQLACYSAGSLSNNSINHGWEAIHRIVSALTMYSIVLRTTIYRWLKVKGRVCMDYKQMLAYFL